MRMQSSVEPRAGHARAATASEALSKALACGLSGGAAQGINVVPLMWLRTTMNVQMPVDAWKTIRQVPFASQK